MILNGIFRLGFRGKSDIGADLFHEGVGHIKLWRKRGRLREQPWQRPQTGMYLK